jgi:hypothetical protein
VPKLSLSPSRFLSRFSLLFLCVCRSLSAVTGKPQTSKPQTFPLESLLTEAHILTAEPPRAQQRRCLRYPQQRSRTATGDITSIRDPASVATNTTYPQRASRPSAPIASVDCPVSQPCRRSASMHKAPRPTTMYPRHRRRRHRVDSTSQ